MNWKFWKKKVASPSAVMSDLERAILEDFKRDPLRWVVRETKQDDHPAVRADKGSIALTSYVRWLGGMRFETIASCGALEFSSEFSEQWHEQVSCVLRNRQEAERGANRKHAEGVLTKMFLT